MSEIVITQNYLGNIIEAHLGDLIVFHLEENLTTGYGWEVETKGSVVEFIESTYAEAHRMTMGRGGMRVIRFAARSLGSQEIRLRLHRPWDPSDSVLEHVDTTIRVGRSKEF